MTERVRARHRAELRPSTPLTGITSTITAVVGDHAATVGRGGVVVAVSGGLVAAMGLPANAATGAPGDTARTAAVPLLPQGAGSAALTGGADALASGPVSAPIKARVSFEHSAFTAVAKNVSTTTATPASATREIATISRTLARAAYRAAKPVAKPAAKPAAPARRTTNELPAAPVRRTTSEPPANSDDGGTTTTPAPQPVTGTTSSVVAIAMRYLGIAYRYGGSTPRGFDCSGFTRYVLGQVGVSLPRTAQQQLNATTRIARSQARAGDLVFFLSGGNAYHVGIYLGNGKMIDSPHSGTAVSVRSVYSANTVFTRI